MEIKKQSAENLRYLLWSKKHPRSDWINELTKWTGGTPERARELLYEGALTPKEQKSIEKSIELTESDLQNAHLLDESGTNILKENVTYILDCLEHGEAKKLAEYLQVEDDTISEWKRWRRKDGINKKYLSSLIRYFGLGSDADLEKDPFFLSLEPIGERARKQWLKERIERIDSTALNDLFPAFKKLLK